MDVSDVLRDRRQEPQGLQQMLVISLLVHSALAAGFVLAPPNLLRGGRAEEPRLVMRISLGEGVGGTESGGLTAIGARPVQVAAPVDPKRPEPVRPPAAKAPEMTVPEKGAPRARQSANVQQAPDQARGRTPTRGAEASPGSALAQTVAKRGEGFGLATGGREGTGSSLEVDDFCCPDYVLTMVERIRSNWNQSAGRGGETLVRFTIQRDGTITDVQLFKPSGNPVADVNAQRAVVQTARLPALPAAFPNPTLTVRLSFQYTR
jgi:TonB family protein